MLDTLLLPASAMLIFISAANYGFGYLNAEISHWRSFWKTLPVGLMAFFAAVFGGPILIITALALSAIGDFFLSRDEDKFTIGLVSFLLAHILYIIFFWQTVVQSGIEVSLNWGHAAMIAYAIIFGAYLWPRAGEFRIPVLAYVIVITVMVSVALLLSDYFWVWIVGALFFALSDSVLALEMFVIQDEKSKRSLAKVVWSTYIIAQSLLATAVLQWV